MIVKSGLHGLLLAICILTTPLPVQAQRKAAASSHESCVDVATLRQGKSVRGLIVAGDGNASSPWLLAAERANIQSDNPALFQRAAKAESQKAIQAYEELKKRIEQELAQPDLNAAYKSFLDSEFQRIAPLLTELQNQAELKDRFMWLELTNKDCSGVRRAAPDAQRVAVWAWSENLRDVTKRDRAELERELTQANIDVKSKLPDLSRELPPRPESEDNWFARLGVVRYTLAGGLDFQGSNGVFVRAGHGQAAGAAEIGPLIQKMMGGSLGSLDAIESLLADLDPAAKANKANKATSQSNDRVNWFSSVTSPAESLGKREFRITRLDPDPSGQAATVETALVVKLPKQGWHIVWSSKQTKLAADITPTAEEQIANDPQVKTALGFISALGVGAEAEIKKAIRFGAATMAAQKSADSDFLHFRDRYIDRLDGPPLN